VRAIANSQGLENSREILANLGETLIKNLGWEKFCRDVIKDSNWQIGQGLLVDGIRHVEALSWIKQLTHPIPTYLIHLDLPNTDDIQSRQCGKGIDPTGLAEKHSTEVQVIDALPDQADLILDASKSPVQLVNDITDFIRNK
jgi:hypothetical protein